MQELSVGGDSTSGMSAEPGCALPATSCVNQPCVSRACFFPPGVCVTSDRSGRANSGQPRRLACILRHVQPDDALGAKQMLTRSNAWRDSSLPRAPIRFMQIALAPLDSSHVATAASSDGHAGALNPDFCPASMWRPTGKDKVLGRRRVRPGATPHHRNGLPRCTVPPGVCSPWVWFGKGQNVEHRPSPPTPPLTQACMGL